MYKLRQIIIIKRDYETAIINTSISAASFKKLFVFELSTYQNPYSTALGENRPES